MFEYRILSAKQGIVVRERTRGKVTKAFSHFWGIESKIFRKRERFVEESNKKSTSEEALFNCSNPDYNLGPAATKALPASFPSNFLKFLIKRSDKSLAFVSQSLALL